MSLHLIGSPYILRSSSPAPNVLKEQAQATAINSGLSVLHQKIMVCDGEEEKPANWSTSSR